MLTNKYIDFIESVMKGDLSLKQQLQFLDNTMNINGEQIAQVVEYLRDEKFALHFSSNDLIDICGTGGSGLPRINTSTIASVLLSKLDIKIAKHGNKGATSRVGSFDLIDRCGFAYSKNPQEIEKSLNQKNLAFLFAPAFYPELREFAQARKALSKPSFFNLLGPLLNPLQPSKHLIGTPFKDKMYEIAKAAKLLGREHVIVVSGDDGLDDVTLTGPTYVVELLDGKISKYTLEPADFGLDAVEFTQIKGGDLETNYQIACRILDGDFESAHAKLVLINMAMALRLTMPSLNFASLYQYVLDRLCANHDLDYKEDILLSIAAENFGRCFERQNDLSLRVEDLEINISSFVEALSKNSELSLIAEIKKASPSEGNINIDLDVLQMIRKYEDIGAACVSVLVDKRFAAEPRDLQEVSSSTKLPTLYKGFVVDAYQILEARHYGAAAVLLIVSYLSDEKLHEFYNLATKLGMDCVVEVFNQEELERALKLDPKIIQINNRNLKDFSVDLGVTNILLKSIPDHVVVISASGYLSIDDIQAIDPKVNAVLIGTALVKDPDLRQACQLKFNT